MSESERAANTKSSVRGISRARRGDTPALSDQGEEEGPARPVHPTYMSAQTPRGRTTPKVSLEGLKKCSDEHLFAYHQNISAKVSKRFAESLTASRILVVPGLRDVSHESGTGTHGTSGH